MAMFWTIFGLIAGLLCISSYVPQILKGYQTKKLDDISYHLMSFMGSGMFLWILYGIHIGSIPIIVTNVMGVSCNSLLIFMKYRYTKNNRMDM